MALQAPSQLVYYVFLCIYPFLSVLYPIPQPPVKRRTVPLEVLALGLSRTGTESLRTALEQLGYGPCYHGWVPVLDQQPDSRRWTHLLARKYWSQPAGRTTVTPDPDYSITAKDFDELIGDCRAVSDVPCAVFAPELIRAYPNAKVVLNKRGDLNKWKTSMDVSAIKIARETVAWMLTNFDKYQFWLGRMHLWEYQSYWGYDFERNAKIGYEEHYARLKGILEPEQYLEWDVHDGWEPLCKFLGKPMPATPFPRGNTPADYQKRLEPSIQQFKRSIGQTAGMLVAAGTMVTAYRWGFFHL